MRLRRLILFSSCFVLALAVLSPGAAYGKEGGTSRPLKGKSTSTSTVDLAAGTATIDGTSQLNHCGKKVPFHDDFKITVVGDAFSLVGPGNWVCANGDELRYTAVLMGTLSTNTSTGVFKITGGTGRYAGAKGSFAADGQSTIVSDPGSPVVTTQDTNTVDGLIRY